MISAGAAACRARARLPQLILALALTVPAPGVLAADALYVIEQLVVGVNSAPGGTGDKVATIKSGDRVELLDRQGDEVQIQLANGASGWVKASYLSAELPLQRRLQDRTTEVDKLKQDVSRLESQLAARLAPAASGAASGASSGRVSGVPSGAASGAISGGASGAPSAGRDARGAPAGSAPTPAGGPLRDPSPFMSPEDRPGQPPWVWVLGCSAAALALGFAAGWRMLDRRIRRKYGGLRIY